MKLIQNWREAWKMHSVQVYALLAALPLVWMEIPDEVKQSIPEGWRLAIISILAVAGAILRLRDQTGTGQGK